jgi:hypothetical protein
MEITLKISDSKFSFFMEMISNFSFVEVVKPNFEITQEMMEQADKDIELYKKDPSTGMDSKQFMTALRERGN